MLVLRDPELAKQIADPALRATVEQWFAEVCAGEAYDYDLHGYAVVVEPGDTVAALEEEVCVPILRNLFEDIEFGDPDFSPSFEVLEEHPTFYLGVFILNDGGFGIVIFIPKADGIDVRLLAMCSTHAVPAPIATPLG